MKKVEQAQTPKVVVTKTIHAKRERVFEAFTKPEQMQQWMFPRGKGSAKATNDLRVGGSFSNLMILDENLVECGCMPITKSAAPKMKEYPHTGQYLEIDPPSKLVFTWNSLAAKNSRVTVEFREVKSATEITITHELLETQELRESHSHGWGECLENLGAFLG